MPGPIRRPGPLSPPSQQSPRTTPHPVGQTGGKGVPVAPKAVEGWTRLAGALATQLPTARKQALRFNRAALRALR